MSRLLDGAVVWLVCGLGLGILVDVPSAEGQLIPGSGRRLVDVGDDFEDPEWVYVPNLPKSSTNIDNQDRQPAGQSQNGRLYESTFRGQPDVIQRVPTPAGGLPKSTGALLLRSLQTGPPGRPTFEMQQDDLLLNVTTLIGGYVPVEWSPSVVTRVYLPPFEQWERRTGSHFGMRLDLQGYNQSPLHRRKAPYGELESYWPGIFIQFNSKADRGATQDSAVFLIRANDHGQDLLGPQITQTGWWTLGMSVTPDGRVHYYASPGVDKLSAKDYVASSYPHGFRAVRFQTFFFNVVNMDNGRNWSTPWIIDDPTLFVLKNE